MLCSENSVKSYNIGGEILDTLLNTESFLKFENNHYYSKNNKEVMVMEDGMYTTYGWGDGYDDAFCDGFDLEPYDVYYGYSPLMDSLM